MQVETDCSVVTRELLAIHSSLYRLLYVCRYYIPVYTVIVLYSALIKFSEDLLCLATA